MANYSNANSENESRVLFTGKGEIVMNNLIEYAPQKFHTKRCSITGTDFIGALNRFRPHVVVVSLMNETRDMLRMYHMMKEDPRYINIPIIALGKQEDCENFGKLVIQKFMEILVRPFDVDYLWQRVEAFVQIAKENEYVPPEEPEVSAAPAASAAAAAFDPSDEPSDTEKKLVKRIVRETRIEGRRSILVVDDDILMLNTIKQFLQDLYDVTVVPSGKLALKFLSKKEADLVLLDYMMPDMDGPAVLEQIRKNTPCSDVPVLFLTGVSDKELVMRGLEFRPSGYLLKPVTREELLERVTEIVLDL